MDTEAGRHFVTLMLVFAASGFVVAVAEPLERERGAPNVNAALVAALLEPA